METSRKENKQGMNSISESADFRFIFTKFLREKLAELTASANASGERIVRWTDLLEAGVRKLTSEDIAQIRAERMRNQTSKA